MRPSRLREETILRVVQRHRRLQSGRLRTILKCPRCGGLFHANFDRDGAISLMCGLCKEPC